MGIFDKIFSASFLCIFCEERKPSEKARYRKGGIGVCGKCMRELPMTGKTGAFEGTKNVSYLLSPLYYEGKVRSAILKYKFDGCPAYSDILYHVMRDGLSEYTHLRDFDLVVPVPLSKRRMSERGYNQAALLAKPFAAYIGVEYDETVLTRPAETEHQSRLGALGRSANLQNAFAADDAVIGKRIILVDDIFTTGNTMEQCARALKSAGAADIAGVSLAVTKQKNVPLEYLHIKNKLKHRY